MRCTAFAGLLIVALATFALAGEKKLIGPEIMAILTDKTLTADGEVEQIFQAGGQTVYIERGSVSQGQWRVEGDHYCSVWPPSEFWACYDVVQVGDMLTFVSSTGTRFPMKLPLVQ